MKKQRIGLVIGKFYPFHKGHQFLIETALRGVEKLIVIICQTDKYKIDVNIRAAWIKSTFPEVDLRIFHHSEKLDSDSPEMSKIWADTTKDFLGFVPDIVYSSEKYGEPYATFMGSKHVLVDLPRRHIPISASKIRADLNANFDYLTDATKAYFAKRIVIIGAESTGTTTLAQDLAEYYNTPWVPEYGRFYYEGKMNSKDSKVWTTKEFVHIAHMQNQMEDALAKRSNKVLICDTDSFATELWHERYLGSMSVEVKNISLGRKPDLYILTNTDIPFVQDGTRDGEHIRQKMHQKFLSELKVRKLPYLVVSGSKKSRLSDAVKKIDLLIV